MFDLTANYFELLDLEQDYQLDLKVLKEKYLELQREVHPDKFASESEKIQREAIQRVSYLNQAYETLKSPLQRAIYLLQISGNDFDPDTQIHNDAAFLLEQMELREELSEVSYTNEPLTALEELNNKASLRYKSHQEQFSKLYSEKNWQDAAVEINKMMFAKKLLSEISEKEEMLF